MNANQSISAIETYLYGLFNNVVSAHTYVGSLPETIKASWNDMLLIQCDNGVNDYEGYGNGTVLLFLYARPRSDGSKNVNRLSEMETAARQAIDGMDSSGDYYLYHKKSYSDYDYSRNWHCNIISVGITAK